MDHWSSSWQVPWLTAAQQRQYSGQVTPRAIRRDPPPRSGWLGDGRSRRQFGLFAIGAGSILLTTWITRRVLVRKRSGLVPRFYRPSNEAPELPVSGPLEALQALQIATLNVASISWTLVFGTLWALDISTLDDLRRKVRGGLGVDGSGRTEQEVEEHLEEWIAAALDRRRRKDGPAAAEDIPDTGIITTVNARGRPR